MDCVGATGHLPGPGELLNAREHATLAARYRAGPGFVCLSGMPPGPARSPTWLGRRAGFPLVGKLVLMATSDKQGR